MRSFGAITTTGIVSTSVAGILVRWVTMRTVFAEDDVPAYGFPLPWYAWGHASSGEYDIAILPFLCDFLLAVALVWPLAWVLVARAPRARPVLAGLGLASALLVHLSGMLEFTLGVYWPWWDELPAASWPVECRSVWVGERDWVLDYGDRADACVVRRQPTPG